MAVRLRYGHQVHAGHPVEPSLGSPEVMVADVTLYPRPRCRFLQDAVQCRIPIRAKALPLSVYQELIGKVWNFFQNVYVRYALLIAEFSWYRENVTPSWSAVLTQPTQTGERGLTTFQSPGNLNDEIKGEEGSDG